MNTIRVVTDEDFGLDMIEDPNPIKRKGARGIVVDADGKIAVFYKEKENVYKLPGGGIDEGETAEQAFVRECFEEAGCVVEIVDALGVVEEIKTYGHFRQTSFVYVGRVVENTGVLHITEKERQEGAYIIWKSPEEALQLMAACVDQIKDSPCDPHETAYASKFMVLRDRCIVEEYLKSLKK
ncbi:MAG: NUDIX domain-containing protein [Clostridia bacterium]|nr:NUDIX domain-containing protein [Clostridia bacterium]